MIERCIGCTNPVMASIEGVFVPLTGRQIRCTLCRECALLLECGDKRLMENIELRLLLASQIATDS